MAYNDMSSVDTDGNPIEVDSDDVRLMNGLAGYVRKQFNRAEDARYTEESKWIKAYKNYRGVYDADVQFLETEKSRVFIKVTKTKVLAAYSQIVDVLLANDTFPITIEPSILPEGVAESVSFDPKEPPDVDTGREPVDLYGYEGDGQPLPPGATQQTLEERLGPLEDLLGDVPNLREGEGKTQSSVTFHPAMIAAKKMEKQIKDQLEESHASTHLRYSAFECALFGTGIIKGPFASTKEYPNWDDEGEYNPTLRTVPEVSHTSIWDFYPDPDGYTINECDFIIERHKLTRSQLRALRRRPFFNSEAIAEAIDEGENYEVKWWEYDLINTNEDNSRPFSTKRYEALEFWGVIDRQTADDYAIEIPEEFEDAEELHVNIWECNGQILRFVMNPFTPKRLPYSACPYEVNPYNIFGIGVGENMDDTQTLMNGFMRMAVDNAVLSGNLLIEVDETNLTPGQDLTVYPGKVFRRQGGAPGQAIFGTKFPNVSSENMMLFDKARILADESTGIPSFSHGQTGVTGIGRTAAGISMLMGAAAGSIKTVVKNFDDYMLKPLGEALFQFNMQFNYNPDIKGDLEVRARGLASLMQNEVRSQRLMSFLQITSNPVLAPFAKFPYIIREIARTMSLDPEKVTNTPEEMLRQAALMQEALEQQQQQQGATGPLDMTGGGGGVPGVGAAAVPGEQQFTGAPPAEEQLAEPPPGAGLPPGLLQ
tara:strand:- start:3594 stop:5720 length:2127 start_codon:yes stop_codon:yes gene_type:complete